MTGLLGLPDWLGKPLGVFLIDILLAGDNALVIGMVCATLPVGQRRGVLAFGTGAAVLLRMALTLVAGSVLAVSGLKLLGGLLLVVLALNLARPEAPTAPGGAPTRSTGVLAAAALVTVLDVLMSLDNVLALAAVAGDSWVYLGLGLLLSISIVMFGSALVADLLGRFPDLTRLGAALLGWTAGQLVLSDGLLGDWVTVQAPALPLVVPPGLNTTRSADGADRLFSTIVPPTAGKVIDRIAPFLGVARTPATPFAPQHDPTAAPVVDEPSEAGL